MADRPRGKFGLPRLTDLGPNVSYHNNPPSDCTVKHCYGGKTKREIVVAVRDAFLNHKDNFEEELKNVGIPVKQILIAGSFVRGDFGCRDKEKALREFFNIPPVHNNPELQNLIKDVQAEANSSSEAIQMFKSDIPNITPPPDRAEQNWNEIILEDMYVAFCSDVDIFVGVEDHTIKERNRLVGNDDYREIRSEFMSSMNEEIPGHTFAIVNITNVSLIDGPVISSREDFNKLLKKYY